jgi:signal transduction histidine kinase
MRLYLHRKILIGFTTSIIILFLLAAISLLFFKGFLDTVEWGSRARELMFNLERSSALVSQIESVSTDFKIDENNNSITSLKELTISFSENMRAIISLTKDEINKEKISELQILANSLIHQTKMSTEPDSAGASVIGELARSIIILVNRIQAEENLLIKDRSIKAGVWFRQFAFTFLLLVTFILLLMTFLIIKVNRTLKLRFETEGKIKAAELSTRKANAELESFSSSVSHDLRAPLRTIAGYAEILKKSQGPHLTPDGNRLIAIIISNSLTMEKLIDDLLNLSKVNRDTLTRTTVDMELFVKPIWNEVLKQAGNPEVEIVWKELGRANIDINLFRQVWINIFSNAIKYSGKKEKAQVEVGTITRNAGRTYYVKDNGAGFDMKYSDKLFGAFQRLHKQSEFEGTGVGLALVKRIVERHKGKVWAESIVKEGATFYFTIPDSLKPE